MPEPSFEDVLDQEVHVNDENASVLIDRVCEARVKAAYWQGVAEERMRMVDALGKDRELTIGYLKDRLNRAELPKQAE